MCGIVGAVNFSGFEDAFAAKLEQATLSLKHRGPNHHQTFLSNHAGLGHTRLSIINPTSDSNQPFASEDGRFQLVFNGEIYNYKELRVRLQEHGVSFRTDGDTEVLLRWLIRNGKEGIAELNGCFAFALWDKEKEEILLARDEMGIKPLIYYLDNDQLFFASETRALKHFEVPFEVDQDSLRLYLELGFVPSPHSIVKGVKKLEPGCALLFSKDGLELFKWKKSEPISDQNKSLEEVLAESVRLRLQTDRPLGIWLSGGVDSSILAELALRQNKGIPLYTMTFPDHLHKSELGHARAMAKHLGSDLNEVEVRLGDLDTHLTDFLKYMDEPFADSTALLIYILSKKVSNDVAVILSGDGADELFAGYKRHKALYMSMQGGLRNSAIKLGKPMIDLLARGKPEGNKLLAAKKYASGLARQFKERYWVWSGLNDPSLATSIIDQPSEKYCQIKESFLPKQDNLQSALLSDQALLLPDQMLQKGDKYGLANALEVRVPFLDREVVQWANSKPIEEKITDKDQKIALKEAFRKYMPKGHFERPKQGFEMPLKEWFSASLDKEFGRLTEEQFIRDQGLFNVNGLSAFINSMNCTSREKWTLLMFQLWWERYIR